MPHFRLPRVDFVPGPARCAPGFWLRPLLLTAIGAGLFGTAVSGGRAAASFTYSQVSYFSEPGRSPLGALVQGGDGAFYGVGSGDGVSTTGLGVIYRLTRDGSRYTELRKFTGENGDGALPRCGLTLGSDGALYGTTHSGGDLSDPSRPLGKGIIYKINIDGTGYTILRTFRGGATDGQNPNAALLQGTDGVLYGTTTGGGAAGSGTVFRMNRDGTGFALLKSFSNATYDGTSPLAALIQGSDGVLYGTTIDGGENAIGTLFRLNRDGTGFAVLKQFSEQIGGTPRGRLLEGADGALYGTTSLYGPSGFSQGTVVYGGGTLFKINRDGSNFTLLKTFGRNAEFNPQTGVVQHRDGTLLGTLASGLNERYSAVFSINPDGTGYTVLKSFSQSSGEGYGVSTDLTLANDGLYYGSTTWGRNFLFALTPQPASRLANLSVRSLAGTGNDTLVVGFVLSATPGKRLLIRGIGPRLADFGVAGVLADPVVSLFSGSTLHSTNDDWGQAANAAQIVSVSQTLSAFALNSGSRDAVLLPTLTGGLYSVQVSGKSESTGVAMIEIYDADPAVGGRLVNVSARSRVGTGDDILIAGFIITGSEPARMLIRGVGPTLTAFGVTGVLADPQLAVYGGSALIRQNDNWGNASDVAAASATAGAFALPADSKDAAMVVTLYPGAYTAQVSGVNNTTGVALVEVYELEASSPSAGGYTLVTSTAGPGRGTISTTPAGPTYAAGTTVQLVATPASGSSFAGWSGSVTASTASTTVTMDGNKTVTATFNLTSNATTYTLTTATAGSGQGTITASPAGPSYAAGTVVTLTATPASGSTLAGWSGDGTGTTTRSITMDSNRSVTATFNLTPTETTYSLTTTTAGNGQGSISATPTGPTYTAGTTVQLVATPASGSSFGGWSGSVTASTAFTILTMDGNKTLTATFNLLSNATYTLRTTTAGTGQGTITASPAGPTYTAGTVVTLTATPASGSSFAGWSGDGTGTTTRQLTMDGDRSVTATFNLNQTASGPSSILRVLSGQIILGSYDPNRRNSVVNGGTLLADGGTPFGGYTWSLSSGSALPAGVGLSPDGIISHNGGTVIPGTSTFSVTVSDGTRTASGTITFRATTEDTTPVGGIPGTQNVAVLAQYPLSPFVLVSGRTNLGYGASLYAIFGTGTAVTSVAPLTWALGAGSSLPAGLTLDAAKGVVWGTPTTAGTYQFTVSIRGRNGETAVGSPTYTLRIDP